MPARIMKRDWNNQHVLCTAKLCLDCKPKEHSLFVHLECWLFHVEEVAQWIISKWSAANYIENFCKFMHSILMCIVAHCLGLRALFSINPIHHVFHPPFNWCNYSIYITLHSNMNFGECSCSGMNCNDHNNIYHIHYTTDRVINS